MSDDKIKSDAVMDFCKAIAGAIDSGFLDDGFSIEDLWQMGRDHIRSRYDSDYPSFADFNSG